VEFGGSKPIDGIGRTSSGDGPQRIGNFVLSVSDTFHLSQERSHNFVPALGV